MRADLTMNHFMHKRCTCFAYINEHISISGVAVIVQEYVHRKDAQILFFLNVAVDYVSINICDTLISLTSIDALSHDETHNIYRDFITGVLANTSVNDHYIAYDLFSKENWEKKCKEIWIKDWFREKQMRRFAKAVELFSKRMREQYEADLHFAVDRPIKLLNINFVRIMDGINGLNYGA